MAAKKGAKKAAKKSGAKKGGKRTAKKSGAKKGGKRAAKKGSSKKGGKRAAKKRGGHLPSALLVKNHRKLTKVMRERGLLRADGSYAKV